MLQLVILLFSIAPLLAGIYALRTMRDSSPGSSDDPPPPPDGGDPLPDGPDAPAPHKERPTVPGTRGPVGRRRHRPVGTPTRVHT